ncbi:MAG: FMN-binding protein [Planctomycetota bacterium]|jgi:electron transport complex protein RnfG
MSDVELTISVRRPEPSAFRLVATLVVAGLVAGLAVAGVSQITKPMIDANKARELRLAVFKVVPGTTSMQRLALRDGHLVPIGEDEGRGEPTIHAAYDDDGFVGYAIAGEGPGFQDTIRVLYGYDPVLRRITGMHVLESRETPGLGDKIYKDDEFVANFEDLVTEPEVVLVKGGRTGENEVDAITGATISSGAIVRIINRANEQWLPLVPSPGEEPPRPAVPGGPEP